ncbi:MAG: histidinol dehydrogenase [Blastochloris sp.]|nr:histidinol dehydrogenase [Blastochloris sp.]
MKRISHLEQDFDNRVAAVHDYTTPPPEVVQTVRQIINDIRQRGDQALIEITNRFSSQQIDRSSLALTGRVPSPGPDVKKALLASQKNIVRFYKQQVPKSWKGKNVEGAEVGEHYVPLDRVGIYVPGGTAPLVSSALMTITLAKVAGVKKSSWSRLLRFIRCCTMPSTWRALLKSINVEEPRRWRPWLTGPKPSPPFTKFMVRVMPMWSRPSDRFMARWALTCCLDRVRLLCWRTRPLCQLMWRLTCWPRRNMGMAAESFSSARTKPSWTRWARRSSSRCRPCSGNSICGKR